MAETCITPIVLLHLPVVVRSEANVREHWAKRHRRFQDQRFLVRCAWRNEVGSHSERNLRGFLPSTIVLTRLGGRRLDSDNLAGAFKAVRDELAALMEFDDGDDRVSWDYKQAKAKEQGIRVEVYA